MIIYQIYPRSFLDTNGDGIGDLPGITRKLSYIADLGFDAIWISPFFTSPMRDFGYDISDYRGVAPIFGSLHDFDSLTKEAQRLQLKVFIDQVWGHSSDKHPWFEESRSCRKNSKTDWYIWGDPRKDGYYPNNWLSIFGGPAWTWCAARQQYFLHHFLSTQPAFNLRNEEVFSALMEDAYFWIERGVDGIRVDALPHYLVDEELRSNPARHKNGASTTFTTEANPRNLQNNIRTECQPDLIPWIKKCRSFFQSKGKDIVLLGEIMSGGIPFAAQCVAGDNGLQTAYTGELISTSLSASHIRGIIKNLHTHFDMPSKMCWSLGNHDVTRLATRTAQQSRDPEASWRLIVAFYFCLEGHLCWYQGDELGLTEADIPFEQIQDPFGKFFWPEFKGRDGCRTPMVWDGSLPHGGFSTVAPWLPTPSEHLNLAVLSQQSPNSRLSYVKSCLKLRREYRALHAGDLSVIESPNDNLLGFTRNFNGEVVRCFFNFSDTTEAIIPQNGESLLFGSATLSNEEFRLPPLTLAVMSEHRG